MTRRVVVTGRGIISPIGQSVEEFYASLRAGRTGIRRITRFDPSAYASQIAAEVQDFDISRYVDDAKLVRRTDRFANYALAATKMGLDESGLEITGNDADRVGVVWGSGIGGMETWEEQHRRLLERGPAKVSPFFVPMMILNMGPGLISILTGAKGPNYAVVTACASSTHALGEAAEVIRRGDADVMIAGGSEAAVVPSALAGFCSARALSRRNDDPEHACRPFDRDRDGFVIGEGGTALILENLEHARARGAPIYGEILSCGESADAYHVTNIEPGGDGPLRAMKHALDKAGLQPADVDYISAHGPGTWDGDEQENAAVKKLFGDHAYELAISSTKAMTGHQLGAVGATEALVCLLAFEHQFVPPTLNLDNPQEGCDLNYVPHVAQDRRVETALSNSFGFGGHNAVLVLRRYTE